MSELSRAELEAMIRQRLADLLARPSEAAAPTPDDLAPEVRNRAAQFDVMIKRQGELESFIASEARKWPPIVRAAGLTPE